MNSQELIKLVSTVLSSEKHGILYRPELTKSTGSVTSTILLQQMIYWWQRSNFGSFYKFKEPCESALYRPGDSWCEELGFSRSEFDTAIKHIGIKKTKDLTIQDAAKLSGEQGKPIIYWITPGRVTYYTINPPVLLEILRAAYLPKSENVALGKVEILLEVKQESSDTISETTRNQPEKTVDDFSDLEWHSGDESSEEKTPTTTERDYITDLLDYYQRTGGKPSPTIPAAAGGADPYLDGPLTAACEILRITPEVLDEKQRRNYATKIREIVSGVQGGTPELFTQACKAWSKHGPKWKGKDSAPYPDVFVKGFELDISNLMRQILSGYVTSGKIVRIRN